MKLLRIAPAVLLSVLLLPPSGCTYREQSSRLRLALQTEPSTLDPAFAVDYSSGMLSSLIHSNLIRFDPEGRLTGDLAQRWEISDDGTVYTFHLGKAAFSSGREVTSADVVYSFRRLLDPATVSPRWWVLERVEGAGSYHRGGTWNGRGIEAKDDSTVIVRLERPAAHFLSMLSMPSAGIVCREEAERLGKGYGREPCGSGPWRLAAWSEGDEILLDRNTRYRGEGPLIEGISLRIIPEPMTRIAEFEVGGLDILEVPRAELEHWRAAGVNLLQQDELRIVYIGLNNTRPPFSDGRVRRAVNMAVDVDAIIARVLFGGAGRACGVIPAGLRGGAPPVELYPYDPQEARRLLAKAGYGEGLEIEIWQRENPEGGRILESIQAYLAQVGMTARLVTREWGAFKQAVDRGTPDAFYLDWFADYPDPENFLFPLFHSANRGGGGNRTGYLNAEVDSLLDAAVKTADPERRWKLHAEAERIVYWDAPWIFLWFPTRYEVVSPRLAGYRIPVIFNGQRFLDVSME